MRLTGLDVGALRHDFPILGRKVHGKRLVYLDNAATSQKPRQVIDSLVNFYSNTNANIHRGIHALAEESTAAYEAARERTARFIGHPDSRGIVFTRNATEAVNLVRYTWGRANVRQGDEVVVTMMEHHSNFVPWIMLANETGAVLRHALVSPDGTLDTAHLKSLLNRRTKLVAFTHASNVLGCITPAREIADAAHGVGALVLLDAAQSAPHMPVDFPSLGCDFMAFSSHKMMGPTGVGVLAARTDILEAMEPFLGGGSMIKEVLPNRATWADIPGKFEAGTPNVADVIAFGTALDYLDGLGMANIRAHEIELARYALERLRAIPGLTLFGPAEPERRGGVISFVDAKIHPHDLATVLDREGVAIRAGHHCAQPLMRHLGQVATARASFYAYNDRDDADALAEAILKARKFFG